MSSTLKEKIISYVIDNPGFKGADIAARIGVSKKDVNSILYSASSDIVFHDKNFHWFPVQARERKNNGMVINNDLLSPPVISQGEEIVAL